jgi:hypothetical protein
VRLAASAGVHATKWHTNGIAAEMKEERYGGWKFQKLNQRGVVVDGWQQT